MTNISILHNPRCSKSRQTLQLLNDGGYATTVVEYLKTPPDATTLQQIKEKLGLASFKGMMRTKEAEFKEMGLNNDDVSEETLLNAMLTCPKLIERPIVITDDSARIGRPPELVLDIL
ncbi:arsenate reductase (glutaredoxin) [Alteromonas sp. a30]|uniref:arsenate reductase (glutaredoxin) n=1 Tax=Alteromonas sp. a30 TaxID=2730917 RepID=UPI0022814E6B|nr:arsenate reductase (glutaredoxin) [Alteromonas sp. a30]MCY7294104.1 arsenate reductase (glutaredoxin) [Alteromonas sp. a30]